jgi:glutamyl-tRNA synthetase
LVSYQLAVSVDDSEMGITHVVRGRDLLASTPRQTLLLQMLGLRIPAHYIHIPLVLDAQGERLAKRTAGARVRALREAGIDAREILETLAHGLGLGQRTEKLAPRSVPNWTRASWNIPEAWAKADPVGA